MTTPGWYPDPSGGGQRYWDGQAWVGAPTTPTPERHKKSVAPFVILGLSTLVLGGGCVAITLTGSHKTGDTTTLPHMTSVERKDAGFMAVIIQEGIPVDDRQSLLDLAHGICPYLDLPGKNIPAMLVQVKSEQPSFTAEQVGMFTRAAMESFCPDKIPAS